MPTRSSGLLLSDTADEEVARDLARELHALGLRSGRGAHELLEEAIREYLDRHRDAVDEA